MKPSELDYFLHQLNTAFCLLNWQVDSFYKNPTDESKESLGKEVAYLKNMLNNFMIYKKIPKALNDKKEFINLNSFIKNILAKFSNCSNTDKRIEYKEKADFEDINIKTNPFYFEELFRIFLDNALKYTSKNKDIFINIISSDDNNIKISFKNTGVGIDKKNLENIWQPFFTVNGNSSGLGLSIATQISKALNFDLYCDSDGDSFTEFFICIPNNFIK